MKHPLQITLAVFNLVAPVHAQDQPQERAKLRIESISRYEEMARKAADEKSRQSAQAMVKVLFSELKSDFNPKELDDFTLVRIGDYLRTMTTNPRDSLIYYEELLGREEQNYRFHSLLGRAGVNGLSTKTEEIDQAIADYTAVYEKSEERSTRELALLRKIELLMKTKDYTKGEEWAQVYLDREKTGFSKYSANVGLLLAESYDKQNRKEDAIASYMKVWSAHMGRIRVSAPALTRWMELLWDRNNPAVGNDKADRESAYKRGANYIRLTSRFKDKLNKEELELWQGVEKLVKTYQTGL
jgi:hypothetical protein